MPEADEQKKQRIKKLREEEKEILRELGQKYFQGTEEETWICSNAQRASGDVGGTYKAVYRAVQ